MKSFHLITLLFFGLFLGSQDTTDETVAHSPENSKCFSCHGSPTYSYYNDYIERTVTKRMNPYFLIDSVLFYDQNHRTFECTDCHSSDFETFPHDNTLRMEPMPTCLDCHEGYDVTSQFHFEQINNEFLESVHSTKHSEDFTCWMCHNPHTYKINARTNENIRETIIYDNNICLSCHADIDKYNLISKQVNPSVIEKHDWLPNQVAHFGHVRCIECHTQISDDVMVAHLILPKEKAVKKCVECHSQNSRLVETLYKFRAKESRTQFGFLNAITLSNNSYIIGANRNYYLNVISVIIFGGVLFLITVHAILRIVIK
jgi:hypothetical protein